MENSRHNAIAVFDSGLGGLTVLKSLLHHFPNENFIYLGDTARLPYGAKSFETIRKYTEQNLNFLSKFPIKAIVIACNSASSTYPENEFNKLPVFTVIKPGAEQALAKTQGHIGVLGTRATITANIYEKTLLELAARKGKTVQVTSVAAPLFVPLVEEGWIDDPITNLIAYRYAQPLIQQKVDSVIMGCTHYPILINTLKKVFGSSVELIDSGQSIAIKLTEAFDQQLIIPEQYSATRTIRILVTDYSEHFKNMVKSLIHPFQPSSIEVVDLK